MATTSYIKLKVKRNIWNWLNLGSKFAHVAKFNMIYEISWDETHADNNLIITEKNCRLLVPTYQTSALTYNEKGGIMTIHRCVKLRSYKIKILTIFNRQVFHRSWNNWQQLML
jgi:hypothetical protein